MDDAYKHLGVLKRRSAWLDTRIKNAQIEGRSWSHDSDERAAIEWALQTIEEWVELPEPPTDFSQGEQA